MNATVDQFCVTFRVSSVMIPVLCDIQGVSQFCVTYRFVLCDNTQTGAAMVLCSARYARHAMHSHGSSALHMLASCYSQLSHVFYVKVDRLLISGRGD